jgi:hypothetical protein
MKKWEYKVIEISIDREPGETIEQKLEGFLNRAGILGWEMVEIWDKTFNVFILKREKVAKRGRPKKQKIDD